MNSCHDLLAAALPGLAGKEFDWFAIDSEGHLALFATAGEGFVPESVKMHYAQHMSISDLLETPNIGTAKVWDDYAAYGLYVFDWDLPGGPSYTRRARPLVSVPNGLRAKIMTIKELPKFPGSFADLLTLARA